MRLSESHQVKPLLFYIGSKEGWSLRMDFMADAAAPLFPRMRLLLLCSFGLLLLVLAYVSWRWASRFTEPPLALSEGFQGADN